MVIANQGERRGFAGLVGAVDVDPHRKSAAVQAVRQRRQCGGEREAAGVGA
ncbi:hypothetical protein ACFXG4_24720 [Nocardia sp. NPDC059246]|uniref:hypothetical protein n=1 Tax=Nocardia sp. NPDC059246 TaxID=3346789 RepID=UPI003694E955